MKKTIVTSICAIAAVSGAYASYEYHPKAIMVRSNGQVVVVADGVSDGSDLYPNKGRMYIYNSNGTIASTKDFPQVRITCAAMDSEGSVIVGGGYGSSYYLKKNHYQSIVSDWDHTWSSGGSSPRMEEIVLDENNYVYCVGNSYDGSKYNSSARKYSMVGVGQVAVTDATSQSAKWTEVDADTAGKLVVAGIEDYAGLKNAVAYKFSNAGAVDASFSEGDHVHDVDLEISAANRYYIAYTRTYIDRTPGVNEENVYVRKLGYGSFTSTWSIYYSIFASSTVRLRLAPTSLNPIVMTNDPLGSGAYHFETSTSTGLNVASYNFVNNRYLDLFLNSSDTSYLILQDQPNILFRYLGSTVASGAGETWRYAACAYVSPAANGVGADGVYVASDVLAGANFGAFLIETPTWSAYQWN